MVKIQPSFKYSEFHVNSFTIFSLIATVSFSSFNLITTLLFMILSTLLVKETILCYIYLSIYLYLYIYIKLSTLNKA